MLPAAERAHDRGANGRRQIDSDLSSAAPFASPFFSSTAAFVRSVPPVMARESAWSAYLFAVSTSPLRSSHLAADAHAFASQCFPPRSVLTIEARTVDGRSTST